MNIVHKSRVRNNFVQELEVQGLYRKVKSTAGGQVLYPINVKLLKDNYQYLK